LEHRPRRVSNLGIASDALAGSEDESIVGTGMRGRSVSLARHCLLRCRRSPQSISQRLPNLHPRSSLSNPYQNALVLRLNLRCLSRQLLNLCPIRTKWPLRIPRSCPHPAKSKSPKGAQKTHTPEEDDLDKCARQRLRIPKRRRVLQSTHLTKRRHAKALPRFRELTHLTGGILNANRLRPVRIRSYRAQRRSARQIVGAAHLVLAKPA